MYSNKTYYEIGKALNRHPFSVYCHTKNIFGNQISCNMHSKISRKCDKCKIHIESWKNKSYQLIEKKEYVDNPIRPYYSKKEDLFIIEHAYIDKSFLEISEHLERPPFGVWQRLKKNFSTPSCKNHTIFDTSCEKCLLELTKWKKKIEREN